MYKSVWLGNTYIIGVVLQQKILKITPRTAIQTPITTIIMIIVMILLELLHESGVEPFESDAHLSFYKLTTQCVPSLVTEV
jgi:hypothetical protein